jgi:hypothetical protein
MATMTDGQQNCHRNKALTKKDERYSADSDAMHGFKIFFFVIDDTAY